MVRFANGVEAWLKPTDFKNDQVLFTLNALGGASLAAPADYPEATLSPAYIELSGAGGLRPGDIARSLTGKLVSAKPYMSLSTHGISGSAAPAQLETALQLFHQRFVAPGDDPDAFGLLKRQLDAMVANRGRAPAQVFGEKVSQVNTSNHYTSEPMTAERIATLDREKMVAFYHQLFANAADFSFFMVGAFKVDDVIPLLARYVGSLPSTGERTLKYKDVEPAFPGDDAAGEGRTGARAARPDGHQLLRRPGARSGGAGEHQRRDRRARRGAPRHPARGSRPDLWRVGRAVTAAAAARRADTSRSASAPPPRTSSR